MSPVYGGQTKKQKIVKQKTHQQSLETSAPLGSEQAKASGLAPHFTNKKNQALQILKVRPAFHSNSHYGNFVAQCAIAKGTQETIVLDLKCVNTARVEITQHKVPDIV